MKLKQFKWDDRDQATEFYEEKSGPPLEDLKEPECWSKVGREEH